MMIVDMSPYLAIHRRSAVAVGAASVDGTATNSHRELKPSLMTSKYLSPDSLSFCMYRWSKCMTSPGTFGRIWCPNISGIFFPLDDLRHWRQRCTKRFTILGMSVKVNRRLIARRVGVIPLCPALPAWATIQTRLIKSISAIGSTIRPFFIQIPSLLSCAPCNSDFDNFDCASAMSPKHGHSKG